MGGLVGSGLGGIAGALPSTGPKISSCLPCKSVEVLFYLRGIATPIINQPIMSKSMFPALLAAGFALCTLVSCNKEDTLEGIWFISPEDDYQSLAQELLVSMGDYDTLHFRAGTYNFPLSLSVADKTGIVIRGEGRGNTILDFSSQLSGAQALLATNMTDVIFADLTVRDMAGDGIKVKDSEGVSFIRVGAEYSGPISPDNGAYGLYPVTSQHVLVDDCYVRGASDAGIYVGQSQNVVVSHCLVEECVAGIEIENCIYADVFANTTKNNTGGILVFDLPNLPVIKNGHTTRVFDNDVMDNNTGNFAPPGNIVGNVPPGTGIMLLASDRVEVFNNRISGNNIMGVGVISYLVLATLDPDATYDDPAYDPFVYQISIHDNTFTRTAGYPTPNLIGLILQSVYTGNGLEPDIIYDGITNPALPADQQRICASSNGDVQFVNLDAVNDFANVVVDPAEHDCSLPPLPPVVINAPLLSY
jgi:parallel beta-helix repeat protein